MNHDLGTIVDIDKVLNEGVIRRVENNANLNDFPDRAMQRRIDAINGLLVFNFINNEFCIDLEYLTEITKVDEAKISINGSKQAIISLDEQEYKIIQLHKLLGQPELIASGKNRVIFIDIFNRKIAFMVDMISEILTTEFLLVGDTLSMEIKTIKKYIKSVIKFQGRNIFVPDFEKICKDLKQLALMSGISNRAKGYPGNFNYSKGRNY